jgi:ABC-type branched-subunit amino acid transport system ATPase component
VSAPLLEVNGLTKTFGGIRAVDCLSFQVAPDSITGIIGPNGAGKTTVFNLVTGVYRPDAGSIDFEGRSLTGIRPDQIVGAGIARTFQNIRLFNRRTCLENVLTPLLQKAPYSVPAALLRTPGVRKLDRELREKSRFLLAEMGLEKLADVQASALPYGLQRKLEIARALAMQPRLLLLDEPAAGMNPEESRALSTLIEEIRERFNLTILLIEHHMDVVMRVCSHIVVMNFGALLAEGPPEKVRTDERVLQAYLGKEYRNA